MDYQVLDSPDSPVYGTPDYDGLEYDYEVPNQMVVESPGGTSDIHHHWTKGFYGVGGSSWDVFGNEPPATVYGNTGSLYATGPTATQTWAPTAPGAGTYYGSPPSGMSPEFLGRQSAPNPPSKPFEDTDNIEYLQPVKPTPTREKYVPAAGETKVNVDSTSSPLQLTTNTIILILLTVVVAFFWAHLGLSFLQHRYSGELSLEILGMYTLVLTLIFFGFLCKFKI
jgi:hypothetical protein